MPTVLHHVNVNDLIPPDCCSAHSRRDTVLMHCIPHQGILSIEMSVVGYYQSRGMKSEICLPVYWTRFDPQLKKRAQTEAINQGSLDVCSPMHIQCLVKTNGS